MGKLSIVYVLLRFPCLTETFVAEEIHKLMEIGVNISIYSLLPQRKELVHPISTQLLPYVRYVPEIHQPDLWPAQLYFLVKCPKKYVQTLSKLLSQPAPRFSFRLKRLAIFLKSVWLAKELKKTAAPLVHTHFAWLSAAAAYVVHELLDMPFTVTAHAFDIYSEKNDLLQLTTEHASQVVTISEKNKRQIQEMLPSLRPGKITVIRCGIDLNFFQAPTTEEAGSLLRIISVGSLIEKKGHEYLIRACSEIKKQHVQFECTIVGRGEQEQRLKRLIQHLEIGDSVWLAGPQSQTWVKEQLSCSDVFVLACVQSVGGGSDGIPVSMMEAMAMKVPVIATPISGIPELIRHEETGLLVAERDPVSLAQAILRLHQDKTLRKKLVDQGYHLVKRDYNIAANVCQLEDLFWQVIEGKQR